MGVEFRQRTPGDYAKIIWKRKWLIILPAIAVATAITWVVLRLPDVYESSTLIVVKPSTLPSAVVPQLSEDNLTRQLTSIAQVVTSRSSLEPLLTKYDLYRAERQRGEPMESMIEMMRNSIKVEVNTSRNDITNGFNITYRGREPRSTQAVAAELASKYIDEQTKNTINSSASAKQFIDGQVKQVGDELKEIDDRRLDYMSKNLGNLPTNGSSLLNQLTGLREAQKTYISEVGRLQDTRSALSTNLALLKKQSQQMIEDLSRNITDPKTTMGWAQLANRKAQVESELTRLKQEYKEKHPDVIAKQAELDSVQRAMDDLIAEWKDKIKEEKKKLENRPDIAAANAEAEIKRVDGEIKRQQDALADTERQIGSVMKLINSVPGAEVALGALDREYQTKKANYDSLLAQQQKISLNNDAANQQQGEGIQVVDPANLPVRPVAPKRAMLEIGGAGLGLVIGLVLVAMIEIPKLLTIQTTEDAAHYTGLPVLVSVPELLTPKEARAKPRRRRLLLVAGVVVTVFAIPALAFILKATHVFERFVT
jgi:polysaccharide chain length determinant protein (PEP-CTERM system associated)